MRHIRFGWITAGLLLVGAAQGLEAQKCRNCRSARVIEVRKAEVSSPWTPVEFGVRGGFDFDADVGSAGAQLRIPIFAPLQLAPSGDVFFDDAPTEWQLNADLLIRPVGLGGLYGGAGAAFVNLDQGQTDDETEVGLNVIVGLDGGTVWFTTVRPFVEARWTYVDDLDPFRLVAGINVPVTGGFRR